MITRWTVRMSARKYLPIALGLSLLAQSMPLSVAALGLSTTSHKSGMSVPTNSRLDAGAGPDTQTSTAGSNTGSDADAKESTTASAGDAQESATASPDDAKESAMPSAADAKESATASAANADAAQAAPSSATVPAAETTNLAPVKLGSTDTKEETASAAAVGPETSETSQTKDNKVLNATVDKNEFVPKAPVDRTDTVAGTEPKKSRKTKADKKEAFDKQVHDTGMKLGPIQLQGDEDADDKKVTTSFDAKKAELAELWDAALCRNQDIQFVVQKLMPTKDPKHTTAIMLKMLSTAMYGAMAAGGMAAGGMSGGFNPGMYMAQSAGGSLVMQVLNTAQTRQAKKAALTETEAIMLYNMIRGVANQVVDNYSGYRKYLGSVNRSWTDYQDLQAMVNEARSGQDSFRQIECEYMLRKERRDIDELNEDVRRSRQALVDLSGAEAIDRLDKQIAIETQTAGAKPEPIAEEPSKPADAGSGKSSQSSEKGPDKQTAQTPGSDL
jgi:hypothetical protein